MNNIEVSFIYCGKTDMLPDYKFKEEDFYFNRIYYVNDGEVLYKDEKLKKLLQKGHLYILPTKKYSILHTKEKKFNHTWFHVITNNFNITDVIDFDIEKTPIIKNYITLLSSLVDSNLNSKNNVVNVDSEIFKSIGLIISSFFKVINTYENFDIQHSTKISTILNHITYNLERDLSNANLAKLVFLNKYYFVKLFTHECGVTPQKYIENLRISEAKNLLIKGLRVEEVSSKLGFPDSKSFSRSFKRKSGISPTDYKKMHLINI